MSSDRYHTLSGEGTSTLRVKASRFLGFAFPVETEERLKDRLAEIAREHHASRHVCYAWVLGPEGERHRSNDAGEPAGTAGRPVLNRIRAAGLTECAVVVVRYFGGTLLGKAGLIAAYGDTAGLALEAAPRMVRTMLERVAITCSYPQLEIVRNSAMHAGGEVVQAHYGASCELLVDLPRSLVDALLEAWRSHGITAHRHDPGK